MSPFSSLLERHPLVFAHLLLALGAFALGAVILTRRKGTTVHRALGWGWVMLMGGTALSSAFIRDYAMPNIAGITPIHAFTLLVAVDLPRGVRQIRQGRVDEHRKTMRGLYVGGCLVAGFLALLPGRFLGNLLWTPMLAAIA